MTFAAVQRAANSKTWEAATSHRFVKQLGAGTIPDSVLATYLAQDYYFVDAFVSLMGGAVAFSDSPSARMVISKQLGLIANDEDGYFVRALDRLNPGPRAPLPPTQKFIDLMLKARSSYPIAITVLLVAEWLYLDWARDAPTPADWIHAEWIELHRGKIFEDWVEFLKREADRVADVCKENRRSMEDAFKEAVGLELDFFNATCPQL